jgi:hypothetical protein
MFLLRLPPVLHRLLKESAQRKLVPVSLHHEILSRLVDSLSADGEAKGEDIKAYLSKLSSDELAGIDKSIRELRAKRRSQKKSAA